MKDNSSQEEKPVDTTAKNPAHHKREPFPNNNHLVEDLYNGNRSRHYYCIAARPLYLPGHNASETVTRIYSSFASYSTNHKKLDMQG